MAPITRVVNKTTEPYEVYIGRGSVFGNPYTVERYGRDKCISLYSTYIKARLNKEPELVQGLMKLDGKVLGCYCKPKRCHGDILISLIRAYKEKVG